jgi:hypothetical protein
LESVEHETKSPETDFTATPSKLALLFVCHSAALFVCHSAAQRRNLLLFLPFLAHFSQPVIVSEVAHGTL